MHETILTPVQTLDLEFLAGLDVVLSTKLRLPWITIDLGASFAQEPKPKTDPGMTR